MADGNCRNYPPAVFFPSDGVGVDRARKICIDCPVADPVPRVRPRERIEHGVWGGCSERERRRILKRRARQPQLTMLNSLPLTTRQRRRGRKATGAASRLVVDRSICGSRRLLGGVG